MKKVFLFILILIIAIRCFPQNPGNPNNLAKIADVLPPAPNAASLGRYGGIDVGLNSGALNKNIPLYTFNYRQMSVPISLSYHTTGFKVDEIASRVGHGWTLNAGGVITRTIIGSPDEYGTRVAQPQTIAANKETYDFLMIACAYSYSWDTQPDIFNFNFNGYSGQFVFDENGGIEQIATSDLKIEKDFSFVGTWNFKITTPDGIKYYFGGPNATEKTKKTISCGYTRASYEPTAWYLSKIESPIGDYINFVYSDIFFTFYSGVIQSLYDNSRYNYMQDCLPEGYVANKCPTFQSSVCNNYLASQGKYLTQINTSNGGKINFGTTSRFDCGDVLFNQIEVLNYDNELKFLYKLEYSQIASSFEIGTTRPFLTKLIENSPDVVFKKEYKFSYNSINDLPTQLTMAQDHWGYFNGQRNSNLVAKPGELELQNKFPAATANREPDYNYSKKGILSQIQYPTGGSDYIYYEANKYYGQKTIYPAPSTINASVTGTSNWVENFSEVTFTVTKSQPINLTFQVMATGEINPQKNIGAIYLIKQPQQPGSAAYESGAQGLTDGQVTIENIFLDAGTYKLKVKANGSVITTVAYITYQDASYLSAPSNIEFGGLRVAKVETITAASSVPEVKKFYYYNSATPNVSSAAIPKLPTYYRDLKTRIPCKYNPYDDYDYHYCEHRAMFSYSLNNINTFPGGASYGTVIEGFGENFEGGGIEHTYRVKEDEPASLFNTLGDYIGNSPMNNLSRYNGKELSRKTFKKNISGVFIPVKEIVFTYKDDIRRGKRMYGYVANQKYAIVEFGYYQNQVNAFDAVTYTIGSNWEYVEKEEQKIYDAISGNTIKTTTNYVYDNPNHLQLTQTTTTNSKGQVVISVMKYPNDFINLTGSDELTLGVKALQDNGVISKAVENSIYLNATSGSNSRLLSSTFSAFRKDNLLPSTLYQIEQPSPLSNFSTAGVNNGAVVYDSRYKPKVSFDEYDGMNLLQQSKAFDLKTSYLWAYNKAYPIAQATNAAVKDIFYTSFEDSEGNSNDGKTGKKSKTGGYSKALTGLTNGSYILTWWEKFGGIWSLKTNTISVSNNSYNINLSNQIDEVRFYPLNAQLTTYTYDPLWGMTSQTDMNNRITFYDYDSFGRLKVIKNEDGKVLKVYDYKYSQ